jgi:hypothetical protein
MPNLGRYCAFGWIARGIQYDSALLRSVIGRRTHRWFIRAIVDGAGSQRNFGRFGFVAS